MVRMYEIYIHNIRPLETAGFSQYATGFPEDAKEIAKYYSNLHCEEDWLDEIQEVGFYQSNLEISREVRQQAHDDFEFFMIKLLAIEDELRYLLEARATH